MNAAMNSIKVDVRHKESLDLNYQIVSKYYYAQSSLVSFEQGVVKKLLAVYDGSGPNWQKEDMHEAYYKP